MNEDALFDACMELLDRAGWIDDDDDKELDGSSHLPITPKGRAAFVELAALSDKDGRKKTLLAECIFYFRWQRIARRHGLRVWNPGKVNVIQKFAVLDWIIA